jgi:transcriptional regulator with XRE-family HTH domain
MSIQANRSADVGLRVREGRERLQLTRERLAAAADVSVSTVARLELEGRIPNAYPMARLAAAVGLSVDDLLNEGTLPQ